MKQYDFKKAREKIGYGDYSSIPSLHIRVDLWAMKILDEIEELKKEIKKCQK